MAYDSDGENKTSLYSTTTTIYNTYNSSTVIANYNETNDTLNLVAKTASNKDINEINVGATVNFNDESSISLNLGIRGIHKKFFK